LFRLEQAYRHALENYVDRNSRMGLSVLIKETWYKFWRISGAGGVLQGFAVKQWSFAHD
jgi:hypothetical protein